MKGFALFGAAALAVALAGCEPTPVSTAIGGGGGAASASAKPPPSGGSATGHPSAAELFPEDPGKRIDALERALKARDQRMREMEGVLAEAVGPDGATRAGTLDRIERLEARVAEMTAASEKAARLAAEREGTIQDLLSKSAANADAIERLTRESAGRAAALERAEKMIAALRVASPAPNLGDDVPKIESRVFSVEPAKGGPPTIVLDVGRRQGVLERFQFAVVREGKVLAKIALDRVEGELSSGRIVWSLDGEAVRAGDRATTRP